MSNHQTLVHSDTAFGFYPPKAVLFLLLAFFISKQLRASTVGIARINLLYFTAITHL